MSLARLVVSVSPWLLMGAGACGLFLGVVAGLRWPSLVASLRRARVLFVAWCRETFTDPVAKDEQFVPPATHGPASTRPTPHADDALRRQQLAALTELGSRRVH